MHFHLKYSALNHNNLPNWRMLNQYVTVILTLGIWSCQGTPRLQLLVLPVFIWTWFPPSFRLPEASNVAWAKDFSYDKKRAIEVLQGKGRKVSGDQSQAGQDDKASHGKPDVHLKNVSKHTRADYQRDTSGPWSKGQLPLHISLSWGNLISATCSMLLNVTVTSPSYPGETFHLGSGTHKWRLIMGAKKFYQNIKRE